MHQHIPSGILWPHVRLNVMSNGMVVDVQALLDIELIDAQKAASKHGIDVFERLLLSGNAHAVLPYHKAIEQVRAGLSANARTTGRGIGPTYAMKHAYQGVTINMLLSQSKLRARLDQILPEVNHLLRRLDKDAPQFTTKEMVDFVDPYVERLKKIVGDAGHVLREAVQTEEIIFEGAQGTMLDID
ncbi:MAG: adenylosuccinate synthetase, partial [Candidatus Hydrogenedentes bacterium]|nr:adenylosuccinate synthetase [Candidatus Hydrogenedentota bacterium]